MTDQLLRLHDFLNSHWEFSFLITLLFYWLFYRQGYKHGKATQKKLDK